MALLRARRDDRRGARRRARADRQDRVRRGPRAASKAAAGSSATGSRSRITASRSAATVDQPGDGQGATTRSRAAPSRHRRDRPHRHAASAAPTNTGRMAAPKALIPFDYVPRTSIRGLAPAHGRVGAGQRASTAPGAARAPRGTCCCGVPPRDARRRGRAAPAQAGETPLDAAVRLGLRARRAARSRSRARRAAARRTRRRR